MKIFGIIYKITNKINGKVYIGQTTRALHIRWREHCISPRRCPYLFRAIKKYGEENFEIIVIKTCFTIDELNHWEEYYIKELNTLAINGYNLRPGGKNKKQHSTSKNKISKTMLGVPKSEEHCKNISLAKAGNNHPNFGKHLPEEQKKNMSLHHADVSGENAPMAKLTWEKVKEIRNLYPTGYYTHKKLGEMFGVSRSNIGDIIANKIWVK
jgi:group I intron endonuclease